jgi:hypothetical protein
MNISEWAPGKVDWRGAPPEARSHLDRTQMTISSTDLVHLGRLGPRPAIDRDDFDGSRLGKPDSRLARHERRRLGHGRSEPVVPSKAGRPVGQPLRIEEGNVWDNDPPGDGEDEEGRWDGERLGQSGEAGGSRSGVSEGLDDDRRGRSALGRLWIGSQFALPAKAEATFDLHEAPVPVGQEEWEEVDAHRRLPFEPVDEVRKPAECDEQDGRENERPGRHSGQFGTYPIEHADC